MVVRLLVQPGEGQHWIVPNRHEPLPANATIENSLIASTALAAGYTSYAASYGRGFNALRGISIPALFIKSSARAGVWCASVGAAVNWYYHHAFTTPVVAYSGVEQTPWKLWDKTDKYTVDDGFLAGAGLGLCSALLLRRMPISWWARCVGMTNIGGFAGVAAAHGYFQYKGERQPAVKKVVDWRKRRNLEFHWLYWNKVFMATLSPTVQGYVIFNAIFKANSMPEEVLAAPEKYGIVGIVRPPPTDTSATSDASSTQNDTSYHGYYNAGYNHAENLKNISVKSTEDRMQEMQLDRSSKLNDCEWLVSEICRKEYEFCHAENMDEDEKQRRIRELQLLEITFNRLRSSADELDRLSYLWTKSLLQKAAWAHDDKRSDWTPTLTRIDPDKHVPTVAVSEVTKFRDQLATEVEDFEKQLARKDLAADAQKNTKKDLDDGRMLLRAADRLVYEFEKKVKQHEKEAGDAVKAEAKDPEAKPDKDNLEASKP